MIDNVLYQLTGVPRRSWAGGPVPAPLRYGEGGAPSAVATRDADIAPQHLVGGGALAPLRLAKSTMVRLSDDASTDVETARAAEWICAATEMPALRDAVAFVLSCSTAVVNAAAPAGGPSVEASALIAHRDTFIQAVGVALDATTGERAAQAGAKLTTLEAGGLYPRMGRGRHGSQDHLGRRSRPRGRRRPCAGHSWPACSQHLA